MHDSFLNNIIIYKAEVSQLPQLKRFFKENGFRAQAAKSDHIYVAKYNNKIIGALRLCSYEKSWLLRSMCITEDYRQKGIGTYILTYIKNELKSSQCYCFSFNNLENFYQKAGFKCIETDKADLVIADMYKNYLSKGKNILLMQYSDI